MTVRPAMIRVRPAWGVLVAGLLLASCVDGRTDSQATSVSSVSSMPTSTTTMPADVAQPSKEDCVEIAVDAYNSLDISGLDPFDGFDTEEREIFATRAEAMAIKVPEIGDDGTCMKVLDTLTNGELAALADRFRPDVAAALGAMAQEQLDVSTNTLPEN